MASSYVQGHDAATLASHKSRSADKQADYLLPHLRPESHILDVGCGPGTITCDFANIALQGQVTGVDASAEVIEQAKQEAVRRNIAGKVSFDVASAHQLPYADESFDVVHCHALLVHLPRPVDALREMRRVCKAGGFVAAREPDFSACVIHPSSPALDRWKNVICELKRAEGAEPYAGQHLGQWAVEAGFSADKVQVSCNVLSYHGKDEVKWWGELYVTRMQREIGKRALSSGLASQKDIDEMIDAYSKWSRAEQAIWALMHMRLLCQK